MIKVVLFDLGSTLIYARNPWKEYYLQGDSALVNTLENAGYPTAGKPHFNGNETFMERYYAGLNHSDNVERTSASVLKGMLQKMGHREVPMEVIDSALKSLYESLDQNWFAEEDALPTLAKLKSTGYHLGIISNTSDDAHVQRLIDRDGFRPSVDFIITSAGFGIRKPDKSIFQKALDFFNVSPGEAAMVGDTPEADVLGANHIGIYSIWITRRASVTSTTIRPNAMVTSLQEIPELVATIGKT